MVDENPDSSLDDLCNWLCWYYAYQGMLNYHPKLRAAECMSALEEQYRDRPEDRFRAFEYEKGQHYEKMMQAHDFIDNLETKGFDPKARAELEHEKLQERANGTLPELTWEWYDNPKRVWKLHGL